MITKNVKTIMLFLWFVTSCSSPSKVPHLEKSEILRRSDVISPMLLRELESEIQIKKDHDVVRYLNQIALKIIAKNPELKKAQVELNLYRNKPIKGFDQKWRIYVLPKNQVYFPIELIKRLSYENEIASLLAVAFSHIVQENMIEVLREYWEEQSLKEGESAPVNLSVFRFNKEMEIKAFSKAVNYLYQAGYDARGLVSVQEQFEKNSDYSPFDAATISEAILAIRKELAIYPPLLNPIVQTHEFLSIKKRILNL